MHAPVNHLFGINRRAQRCCAEHLRDGANAQTFAAFHERSHSACPVVAAEGAEPTAAELDATWAAAEIEVFDLSALRAASDAAIAVAAAEAVDAVLDRAISTTAAVEAALRVDAASDLAQAQAARLRTAVGVVSPSIAARAVPAPRAPR